MVLLYQPLSQVGGYVRATLYPPICLLCVWKDYPSFWKRQFRIELFILLHLVVKLKFPIFFFVDDIFLFSKAKITECHNLKTFFKNSVNVLDKSLVHKNHVCCWPSYFNQFHFDLYPYSRHANHSSPAKIS